MEQFTCMHARSCFRVRSDIQFGYGPSILSGLWSWDFGLCNAPMPACRPPSFARQRCWRRASETRERMNRSRPACQLAAGFCSPVSLSGSWWSTRTVLSLSVSAEHQEFRIRAWASWALKRPS